MVYFFAHFHDPDNGGLDEQFSVLFDVFVGAFDVLPRLDFVCHIYRNLRPFVVKVFVEAHLIF